MNKKLYVILAASMLYTTIAHGAGSTFAYASEENKLPRAVCLAFIDGVKNLNSYPSVTDHFLIGDVAHKIGEEYTQLASTSRQALQAALEAAPTLTGRAGIVTAAFDGFVTCHRAVYSYLSEMEPKILEARTAFDAAPSDYGVVISKGYKGFESAFKGMGAGKAPTIALFNYYCDLNYKAQVKRTFHPYLEIDRWAIVAFVTGATVVSCGDKMMPFASAWTDLLTSYSAGKANTPVGALDELAVLAELAKVKVKAAKGESLGASIAMPRIYDDVISPAEIPSDLPDWDAGATVISQGAVLSATVARTAASAGAAAGGAGAGAAATA